MPIKVKTKVIKNFTYDWMRREIAEKWGFFDALSRQDQQSMFEFALMLCGDDKPDYFVTPCDILLDNKDDIYENTGVRMVTLKEAMKLAADDGANILSAGEDN